MYESVFISLSNTITEPKVLAYTKIRATIFFKFDTDSLKRWRKYVFIENITSIADVQNSLLSFKELKKRENVNFNIPSDIGWSPSLAKSFLKSYGVETGDYDNCYGDEWFCCSKPIELDNGILSNSISYYISGNVTVANKLKLVLNINSKEIENKAINTFINYAETLFTESIGQVMPEYFKNTLMMRKNKVLETEHCIINFKLNKWPTGKGYSLDLEIKHKARKFVD